MAVFYLYVIFTTHLWSSISSINVSPCAKWNEKGITVAGTGVPGSSANQLYEPIGIAIYRPTANLYVADHRNARIQMFSLNDSSNNGSTVASNLFFPLHIYVDDDNNQPTMYITVSISSRVQKWVSGAVVGQEIGADCEDCVGIALDKEKNVYVTDTDNSCIRKWSPRTNQTSTVAGTFNQDGSSAALLSLPQGLHVTQAGDRIFIADSGNSRIQRWFSGAIAGTTVAGSINGTASNDTSSLNGPISIFFDEINEVLYIADTSNHRIMRWLPNASVGDVIIGGKGQGSRSDQLNTPTDLKFDDDGNIYISDFNNHRIQCFHLIENFACHSSASGKKGKYSIQYLFGLILSILFLNSRT